MSSREELTQSRLKELLSYDAESGMFTWITTNRAVKAGMIAGNKTVDGYVKIQIDGDMYLASRLAFLYTTGNMPEHEADHINHDRSDNAWANLRDVSRIENSKNKTRHKNNTSGFTGVSWSKNHSVWRASINIDKKKISLGSFKELDDAINARKVANLKHGYHENHGAEAIEQEVKDE